MDNNEKEMGKKLAQIAIDKPLDPQTILNTCSSDEFLPLSQLKTPDKINSFIDLMFSQLLEQTKNLNNDQEDLQRVRALLNQYGSFVSSLTNKETTAEPKMVELFKGCANLQNENV